MLLKIHLFISIYGLASDLISGKLSPSAGQIISSSMACPRDYFPTENEQCQPFFTCDNRHLIEVHGKLKGGYVKKLFHASWKGTKIVFSIPQYNFTKEDFLHGVNMLRSFQHSRYVAQMVGYCTEGEGESFYLATKFYKRGSANNLRELLDALQLPLKSEIDARLTFALDYLSTLVFLHDSPTGTRVMCDSNDLEKTLSQFLITDDLRLVVADLDALPQVNHLENIMIKCGHRQLTGSFVAPEQLWPYVNETFSDSKMLGYDEMTDIWKIPNVLRFLLGQSNHASQVKLRMFEILRLCKEVDPWSRPDAKNVRDAFLDAIKQFDLKVEL